MNTETPNTNPVPGTTPVSAVNPPVTDAPAMPVQEPVAPAPAPEATPVAPAEPMVAPAPAEPAPMAAPEAPAQGFNAAPASTTPVVDLGTMAAPEAPAEPMVAPAPAEPEVAPAAPAMPMQSAPVMEAAPVAPTETATPTPLGVGDPNTAVPPQNITPANTEPAAPAETPKKKGGAKLLIIIVAVLLVLLVGGYFVYTKVLVTPAKTYDTVIKTLMKEAKEKIGGNNFTKMMLDSSKPYVINGDVSVQSSMEGMEFLNNYKVDFGFGADYKNNKLMLSAGLNEKDKSLLEGAIYFKDKKVYVDLKDLYDNIIDAGEYDFDLSALSENESNDDVEILLAALENALLEGVKAGTLTSSSVKKDVFGKSVSLTDNLYTVDKNNSAVVTKAIIKSLRDDDKAISVIADFAQVEKTDITKALDEVLASDTLAVDAEVNIKVHLYTGGLLKDQLYGIDVEADGKTYYSYLVDGDRSATTLDLGDSKITSDKKGNTNTISLITSEQTLTVVVTQTTNTLNVKTTIETYTFEVDIKEETITNGFKENLAIKFADSETGTDIAATVVLNCKQESYEDIDVKDAVDYLDLTETDLGQIMTNVTAKLEGSELGALAESLLAELNGGFGGFGGDIDNGYTGLSGDAAELAKAAEEAFNAEQLKGANAEWQSTDNVCLSMNYLCENDFLSGTPCEDSWYMGSVLVSGPTGKYNLWITDGFDAYENVDSTLIDSYTTVSKDEVTTTCNGLGSITK